DSKGLESKIAILGLSQSGKTSIRQVVFEGFAPESTSQNPATVRINRKLFNIAGSSINLFDVGGQSAYLNEVFQQYQERTFSDVKAVIFVVDVSDAANVMRSKYYFDLTVENVKEISRTARIYVFAHKMDVVPVNKREAVLQSIKDIFEVSSMGNAEIYGTSIFEDTLWDAMQKILALIFPKDDAKTLEIKDVVGEYELSFLAVSTTHGLVLYSQPEALAGVNYERLRNELSNTFFPGMVMDYAMFSLGNYCVFMREIENDLVLTAVFEHVPDLADTRGKFLELSGKVMHIFQPDELIGQAKAKMKSSLSKYLEDGKVREVANLERRFDVKVNVKCDICGKQVQKSILDVAVENSEKLERGIKVTAGFGVTTIEMYPIHECIEGMREIPVFLDSDLEYRRYDNSRPI
ncbi:MAG: 50S ribosome-binding GTPase, partial [Candidatus Heimdallarchaeota archaeon]|nr:50S ribosome-binding GTPase [Candidatus Heimdallarchaeota archaeon]MCK4878849.1 50S ribosome-binding GTPase [Candidatus Heimdallarchaeota archaeon]